MIDPPHPDPTAGRDAIGDEVAGLAQRAFARSIDLMVVAVVSFALFAPQLVRNVDDPTVPRWAQVAVFLVWLGYESLTTTFLGQTMGKMATGCRVADRRTGARPNLARSVVRAAVVPGLLPFIAVFGLLGYATALLDPREHRGIPDRLAGTVVVRAEPGRRR